MSSNRSSESSGRGRHAPHIATPHTAPDQTRPKHTQTPNYEQCSMPSQPCLLGAHRRPDHVRMSGSGHQTTLVFGQTQKYLEPLYERLKRRVLHEELRAGLWMMVQVGRSPGRLCDEDCSSKGHIERGCRGGCGAVASQAAYWWARGLKLYREPFPVWSAHPCSVACIVHDMCADQASSCQTASHHFPPTTPACRLALRTSPFFVRPDPGRTRPCHTLHTSPTCRHRPCGTATTCTPTTSTCAWPSATRPGPLV